MHCLLSPEEALGPLELEFLGLKPGSSGRSAISPADISSHTCLSKVSFPGLFFHLKYTGQCEAHKYCVYWSADISVWGCSVGLHVPSVARCKLVDMM